MHDVMILNSTRPAADRIRARRCTSFLCRLRGLTFRRQIPRGWGLLLEQKRDSRVDASITMWFMFTDLAVVWINSAGEVVDVRLARRWRFAYFPRRPACYALEMNTAHFDDFQIGDRVRFEEIL
mgnify:FL=1|jgi:uncharacterized membrane protein (UPF0127 family)